MSFIAQAQEVFRDMIHSGSDMAVAWDRDVDQSMIATHPRLYRCKDGSYRAYVDDPKGPRKSLICWEYSASQKTWQPLFRNRNAMRNWQAKYSNQAGDHLGSILDEVVAHSERHLIFVLNKDSSSTL